MRLNESALMAQLKNKNEGNKLDARKAALIYSRTDECS